MSYDLTAYTLHTFSIPSSLDIDGQILHLASERAFLAFKKCLHYKDCVVPVDTLFFCWVSRRLMITNACNDGWLRLCFAIDDE